MQRVHPSVPACVFVACLLALVVVATYMADVPGWTEAAETTITVGGLVAVAVYMAYGFWASHVPDLDVYDSAIAELERDPHGIHAGLRTSPLLAPVIPAFYRPMSLDMEEQAPVLGVCGSGTRWAKDPVQIRRDRGIGLVVRFVLEENRTDVFNLLNEIKHDVRLPDHPEDITKEHLPVLAAYQRRIDGLFPGRYELLARRYAAVARARGAR
jgi:hypothetical protein